MSWETIISNWGLPGAMGVAFLWALLDGRLVLGREKTDAVAAKQTTIDELKLQVAEVTAKLSAITAEMASDQAEERAAMQSEIAALKAELLDARRKENGVKS